MKRSTLPLQGAQPSCPWCSTELDIALPVLEPPPDSVKITKVGTLFESTWLARLVESGTCPACHKEIKIWWYGGQTCGASI
jgi:hypothetical protein